jgi:hypothetical protein
LGLGGADFGFVNKNLAFTQNFKAAKKKQAFASFFFNPQN